MILKMSSPVHKPVLLNEVVEALQPRRGKKYIDCTLGLGGHSSAILEKIAPTGKLLGIDADPESLRIAQNRLAEYAGSAILVNDNFTNLEEICKEFDFTPVDGILFDLGISSFQLETPERGFSFQSDAEPDMRFSPDQVLTAMDLVNILPEHRLAQLLEEYGEEYKGRQIARRIVGNRPITSTAQLARIVEQTTGWEKRNLHPATKTFLALRIAVNHELENLEKALLQAVNVLNHGGRLVVISYHSLEDRIVKQFMKRESNDCICPPNIPVCRCGHKAIIKIITNKVITPSASEIQDNPRSRSAKLRIAERL